jgi:hypothetical protein
VSNRSAIAFEQMIAHYNAQDADTYVALMTDDACEGGLSRRGGARRQGRHAPCRSGRKAMFAEVSATTAPSILKGYELGEFVVAFMSACSRGVLR